MVVAFFDRPCFCITILSVLDIELPCRQSLLFMSSVVSFFVVVSDAAAVARTSPVPDSQALIPPITLSQPTLSIRSTSTGLRPPMHRDFVGPNVAASNLVSSLSYTIISFALCLGPRGRFLRPSPPDYHPFYTTTLSATHSESKFSSDTERLSVVIHLCSVVPLQA